MNNIIVAIGTLFLIFLYSLLATGKKADDQADKIGCKLTKG